MTQIDPKAAEEYVRAPKTKILCQEIIWLPEKGTNTYCMREHGHSGEHWLHDSEPTKEQLDSLKGENATR